MCRHFHFGLLLSLSRFLINAFYACVSQSWSIKATRTAVSFAKFMPIYMLSSTGPNRALALQQAFLAVFFSHSIFQVDFPSPEHVQAYIHYLCPLSSSSTCLTTISLTCFQSAFDSVMRFSNLSSPMNCSGSTVSNVNPGTSCNASSTA